MSSTKTQAHHWQEKFLRGQNLIPFTKRIGFRKADIALYKEQDEFFAGLYIISMPIVFRVAHMQIKYLDPDLISPWLVRGLFTFGEVFALTGIDYDRIYSPRVRITLEDLYYGGNLLSYFLTATKLGIWPQILLCRFFRRERYIRC